MPEAPARALSARIQAALGQHDGAALIDAQRTLPLHQLAHGRFVDAPTAALDGVCAMVMSASPMAAALALASLDGSAKRLVLCPPGLGAEAIAAAAALAEVDAVVTDTPGDPAIPSGLAVHPIVFEGCGSRPATPARTTEWALFTSGTSGAPKLAVHTLAGLAGAIAAPPAGERRVWASFYDIRRYGGLQVLLRALLGGASLVLAEPGEAAADTLERMARHGATHVTGTPTHWRRALMTPGVERLQPRYVRLSGEIADQAVLDALKARWPQAAIGHAYASTEAGVGFEVTDGFEGFPAALLERDGPVALRIDDGVLKVRSDRTALRYLGADGARTPSLRDVDGFVDTGDLIDQRGERLYFVGRTSGVINVGGLKIHPEEVEAVINACPGVRLSRVFGRRSPVLGALVAAEVTAEPGVEPAALKAVILDRCRAALPPYKAPASIRFVEALAMNASGKLERRVA